MGRSWKYVTLVVRAFISLEWFLNSLNTISDMTFNLLKIAAFLLILAFMILLARRVFQKECIPSLIKDLAFKIAFDLALADPNMSVSAKTWRGFMHFTEALEAYYNYTQTEKEGI